MSKPEPPQKIDSLPTSKASEPRKTGWEPPTPQKVRSNERRMGVLLAFSLLAAIGFVAYRKFDEQRRQTGDPQQLFVKTDTNDGTSPKQTPDEQAPETSGSENAPPIAFDRPGLNGDSDADDVPTVAHRSAPPMTLIADTQLPEQMEPGTGAFEMQFGPADDSDVSAEYVDLDTDPAGDPFASPFAATNSTDPPEQLDVVTEASDPFASPLAATDSTDPPEQPALAADTGDPFGGAAFAAEAPVTSGRDEQTTFSSDVESPFGAPATLGQPEFDADVATTAPTLDEPATSADNEQMLETPILSLLGDDDPAPDQSADPSRTPDPARSPWGRPVADTAGTESDPPRRLEINDPQEMPTLSINPFASAEPTPEPEPHPAERRDASGFNPTPAASAVTEVRESPTARPRGDHANPFAGGETMAVRQARARGHDDPFTPAHDVSRAVSEDEVVIHVVQSGDNFWQIAREHYGTGKYSTALAAFNQSRIPDPKRMRPGMKILVPREATLVQQFPQLVSGQSSTRYTAAPHAAPGFSLDASGRAQYRVAKGDTLSEIAQRHLGRSSRWRQIYGMNKDQLADAHSLTTGMVLRLPSDATQVRMDDGRVRGR